MPHLMRPTNLEKLHMLPYASQNVDAIKRLVDFASDFPAIENDVLDLVRKIVGPAPVVPSIPNPSEPTASEMVLARTNKIEAIKAHRNRTGAGLKESKDAIERAGWKLGFMDAEGRLLKAS